MWYVLQQNMFFNVHRMMWCILFKGRLHWFAWNYAELFIWCDIALVCMKLCGVFLFNEWLHWCALYSFFQWGITLISMPFVWWEPTLMDMKWCGDVYSIWDYVDVHGVMQNIFIDRRLHCFAWNDVEPFIWREITLMCMEWGRALWLRGYYIDVHGVMYNILFDGWFHWWAWNDVVPIIQWGITLMCMG